MWLHEIKHDCLARKDDARVRLYSRPGNDLRDRFPLIVEARFAIAVSWPRLGSFSLAPPTPPPDSEDVPAGVLFGRSPAIEKSSRFCDLRHRAQPAP